MATKLCIVKTVQICTIAPIENIPGDRKRRAPISLPASDTSMKRKRAI